MTKTIKTTSLILPFLLILAGCGLKGPATQSVAEQVDATLTAIAVSTVLATAIEQPLQPTATESPSPEAEPSRLGLELLMNGVYTSVDWGEYRLTDGIYYRTPPTSQESRESYTSRMMDPLIYGDINADGVEDAVVFLVTKNGGTGGLVEMATVINLDGNPMNVATLSLGDRVAVEGGAILNGVISLQMRVHGPNDGLCCPSQSAELNYKIVNNVLVQLP